jgi:hypothetical protein
MASQTVEGGSNANSRFEWTCPSVCQVVVGFGDATRAVSLPFLGAGGR